MIDHLASSNLTLSILSSRRYSVRNETDFVALAANTTLHCKKSLSYHEIQLHWAHAAFVLYFTTNWRNERSGISLYSFTQPMTHLDVITTSCFYQHTISLLTYYHIQQRQTVSNKVCFSLKYYTKTSECISSSSSKSVEQISSHYFQKTNRDSFAHNDARQLA